jgi:hypothetical protein
MDIHYDRINCAVSQGNSLRGEDISQWVSVGLSAAGFLVVIGFLSRPVSSIPTEGGVVAWAAFTLLCMLGALATFFPHHCSPSTQLPENIDPSRYALFFNRRLIHGHHPVCDRFSGHEFSFRGKRICASCAGLLLGSVSASSLACLYFSRIFSPPTFSGYIGLIFVASCLLYIPLPRGRTPSLRALMNALFVTGFSLTLAAVDTRGELGLDLITIGLCVFWMQTRIQLSRRSHEKMCESCPEDCER